MTWLRRRAGLPPGAAEVEEDRDVQAQQEQGSLRAMRRGARPRRRA